MKKSLVSLLVLVSVFAVLSGVAVYTGKMKREKEISSMPRKKLFEIKDEANIKRYELVFDGNYITVEKKPEGWFIVSPTNYYADQMEAFANVKNFNTMQIDTIVTNLSEKDLFGLENPKTKFTIIDDGLIHTFYVGNRTADNEKYYVQYNGEYFTIEWVYVDALKKDVSMLRDKDFLKIRPEEVVAIAIYSNRTYKRIDRINATNYQIFGISTNYKLDIDKLYNDFNDISKIQAIGFVADGVAPRTIGLNTRLVTRLDLVMEDKSVNTLYIGRSTPDNKTYIIKDLIYEVNHNIYDAVGRKATEYIKTE